MRLLYLDAIGIQKLIENYESECNSIKKGALSMAWHMRGGASYEDILNMSSTERQEINELIKHNMEVTKKSQLPYF